jgi:hypothetical protein
MKDEIFRETPQILDTLDILGIEFGIQNVLFISSFNSLQILRLFFWQKATSYKILSMDSCFKIET